MAFTIKFKGIEEIPAIIVYSSKRQVESFADINKIDNREVLQIHFSELTDYGTLMSAYGSEDALSEITVIDTTSNQEFVYCDYIIRVALALTSVENEEEIALASNHWVMTIAQLTPTDKKLRQIVDTINKSPSTMTLEEYKDAKIDQSKTLLNKFLIAHPLVTACKNGIFAPYSATIEKQNLFMSQCVAYYFNTQAGIEDELTWNECGKPCVKWTMEEAIAFMNAMKAYTKPLVSAQQQYEVDLRELTTKAEVEASNINYESAFAPNGRSWWIGYTIDEVQRLIEHYGDTETKPEGADEYLHPTTDE